MTIKILAFGISREICGAAAFELDLPDGFDSEQLMTYLRSKFPALEQLSSCSLAVNECYVQGVVGLKTGDEVAIIPPVSGG